MVAGSFFGMAIPLDKGTETYVAALHNRKPALPLEYSEGTALTEMALLKENIPPKLNLIDEPLDHFEHKGN